MISPIFMIRAYLTLSLCLFSALISAKPVPVIFDTDIGSDIDDVFALSLILKSPELDLKLITTVSGDTHYRAKVAAKFLQISKINVCFKIIHNFSFDSKSGFLSA